MIKKGDTVVVITGKDKGKTGKVLRVVKKLDRVLVDGVNIKKKHEKARGRTKKGQIIEKPLPIHSSNVALLDPKGGKPTRVGMKMIGDKKIRVARKSGAEIK